MAGLNRPVFTAKQKQAKFEKRVAESSSSDTSTIRRLVLQNEILTKQTYHPEASETDNHQQHGKEN
eukprot:91085-Pyramimonas_sp.AAC.1